jgi:hypothetical protein
MGLLADLLSKVFGQQTANAGLGGISPPREGVPRKEQRAVANASALLPYRSQVRLTNLEFLELSFHTERESQFVDRGSLRRADLFSTESKESTLGRRIGNLSGNGN